jgi:hypothetical protein
MPIKLYTDKMLLKTSYATLSKEKEKWKGKKVKRREKSTDRELELTYLMPDCWLEVNLYPDGIATGQLHPGIP